MTASLSEMANAIRILSMDAVEKAKSGHPGMPMGMADVSTVLFSKFLKFNPKDPDWADRDRFVLSAGHGSMLLYSLLYLTGYEDITLDEIKNFRQLGAKTCGHPEYGEAKGIETTTGPLGQGIANAVGMALAERIKNAKYGDNIIDHYTYCIVGDGCLMEGISHESISIAGHLKLNKLIVLFDDNHICIDGPTEMTVTDDQPARFKACGWNVISIDGHNYKEIEDAIAKAKKSDKPTMIACRTKIAKSAPTKENSSASHGAPLGKDEIKGARKNLSWSESKAFSIPDNILNEWKKTGNNSKDSYNKWLENYNSLGKKCTDTECEDPMLVKVGLFEEFNRALKGDLPTDFDDAILNIKREFAESNAMATRKSSGKTLEKLVQIVPELIGGSADLTGSVNTKTSDLSPITPDDYSGRYIYYGVREHAMCAMMNGMALHGGIIPYAGTFFVFTDYCRPAIRLAAMMKQRVIYVMTHDSIGLGEDGPTHQPVEHLASLRAMPNLYVYRPADATEVAECWELSLKQKDAPSMLVLSRQNLPNVRTEFFEENLCSKGGYILSDCGENEVQVTIIATGSEIQIALDAQEKLKAEGIYANVVSMPCTSLFDEQSEEYKDYVLGGDNLKIAVEAGISYGWEKYIGRDGIFIGMNSFGASAPANELYEHFGITPDNIVKKVKDRV